MPRLLGDVILESPEKTHTLQNHNRHALENCSRSNRFFHFVGHMSLALLSVLFASSCPTRSTSASSAINAYV